VKYFDNVFETLEEFQTLILSDQQSAKPQLTEKFIEIMQRKGLDI
jgi:hypothetical protein